MSCKIFNIPYPFIVGISAVLLSLFTIIYLSVTFSEKEWALKSILTLVFFLNLSLGIISAIKRQWSSRAWQSESIFLYSTSNALVTTHYVWLVNIFLIIGMFITRFTNPCELNQVQTKDEWAFIIAQFFAIYAHYTLHYSILRCIEQERLTTCVLNEYLKPIFRFIHFSIAFFSFLSQLVINQLQTLDVTQNYHLTPCKKFLFYQLFCKFFQVLRMPLASQIGRICFCVLSFLEIQPRIYIGTERQFIILLILALINSVILIYSIHRAIIIWRNIENNLPITSIDDNTIQASDYQQQGIIGLQNVRTDQGRRSNRVTLEILQQRVRQKSSDGLSQDEINNMLQKMTLKDGIATITQTQSLFKDEVKGDEENNPENNNLGCSICFIPICDESYIYSLRCNHFFHSSCLDIWIKSNNSCPNCRSRIIKRINKGHIQYPLQLQIGQRTQILNGVSEEFIRSNNQNNNFSDQLLVMEEIPYS